MTGVNSWHTNDEFNKNGNKKNYQKEAFVKGELQRIMTITEDLKAYFIIVEKVVAWRKTIGLRSQHKTMLLFQVQKS